MQDWQGSELATLLYLTQSQHAQTHKKRKLRLVRVPRPCTVPLSKVPRNPS